MRKKPKPAPRPTYNKGGSGTNPTIANDGSAARQQFLVMAANMSWQLAVVVLIPIIGGVQLDKHLGTNMFLYGGLAIAAVGSAIVMWQAMQTANHLPVPKLTAAQKRAVQKSYEAEDDD